MTETQDGPTKNVFMLNWRFYLCLCKFKKKEKKIKFIIYLLNNYYNLIIKKQDGFLISNCLQILAERTTPNSETTACKSYSCVIAYNSPAFMLKYNFHLIGNMIWA